MSGIITLADHAQALLDKLRNSLEFIGSVLLRLYLVPVFLGSGQ